MAAYPKKRTENSSVEFIEVFENQQWGCLKIKGWVPRIDGSGWTLQNGAKLSCLEDVQLPSKDRAWTSNWKIHFGEKDSQQDRHGWEYATRAARLGARGRGPRGAVRWRDAARRRRWRRAHAPAAAAAAEGGGEGAAAAAAGLRWARAPTAAEVGRWVAAVARARAALAREAAPLLLGGAGEARGGRRALRAAVEAAAGGLRQHFEQVEQAISQLKDLGLANKLSNDLSKEKTKFCVLEDQILQQKLDSPLISGTELNPSAFAKVPRQPLEDTESTKIISGNAKDSSVKLRTPEKKNRQINNSIFSARNGQQSQLLGGGDYIDRGLLERNIERVLVREEEDEVAVHEQRALERNEGIQEILKSMVTLNEVFKDFAEIVVTQGSDVEEIDANMAEVYEQTAKGYRQILEADRVQQRNCQVM